MSDPTSILLNPPTEELPVAEPNRDDSFPVDASLIRDELLHELFEAQADARPDAIAVECAGERLTYVEVECRANQLARFLRSTGVGPGSCVALLLPRSADVYVTIIAILKTGAAYVPLDPEYPADRVAYILEDCKVHTLICSSADGAAPFSRLACEPCPGALSDSDDSGHGGQARRLNDAMPAAHGIRLVLLDVLHPTLAAQSPARLTRKETAATPDDLCYIIYTSGSTGRPKGVQIAHRSACHLVRAEGKIFNISPHDRVYQGFSIAFDASVEEVWLALFAGATLVAGTAEMVRAGPGLARMLADARVTVLSCVPTLLSMMSDDIPAVRLLIVGGEACPADLVRRWARPGRRMVNTYGPTEATVIATYADLHPDRAVTIGRAIPNYRTYILNESLQPVGPGESGELHIGGIGLARGYVGRPDLTAEKFIADPFSAAGAPTGGIGSEPPCPHAGEVPGWGQPGSEREPFNRDTGVPPVLTTRYTARLYKTGDLVRLTPAGEIEFLGRIDTQVKLRGFRVELAEIESALMQCPGVQSAVVALREDAPGVQQLAAYIVVANSTAPDESALKAQLRASLPVYMIPATIDELQVLPTLPSGKVDRKSLPPPAPRARTVDEADPPRTPRERRLIASWERLFAPSAVSRTDDFFRDLGGHSLLAAMMVSQLRAEPDFQDLSVLDVYTFPTIASLADQIDRRRAREGQAGGGASKSIVAPKPSSVLHLLCSLAQLPCLYFVLGIYSLQWLAPYLIYSWMISDGYGVLASLLTAIGTLVALPPAMLVFAVIAKWVIIGRYKPGRYRVWGWYFLRWWLAERVASLAPTGFLAGTPLLAGYLRLLGARVGRNVHLGSDDLGAYDLISIGDDTSIGDDATLNNTTVENGWLQIGRIDIGKGCFVGIRTVLCLDTTIEDGGRLEDLSLLSAGAHIPAGHTWLGSPAKPIPSAPSRGAAPDPSTAPTESGAARGATLPAAPRLASTRSPFLFSLLHSLGVLILPTTYLLALLPGMFAMVELGTRFGWQRSLLAAPLVAVSFVILLCLEIAAFKWILLGRVKPGRYPIHGGFYLRKWFFDQLMGLSLDVMGPLYATLYLAPWYRLLGAKLGKNAEISTACSASPDMLEIGAESFIADYVSLGPARVEHGTIDIQPTRIGARAFVGNSAMIPAGTRIGDNSLIGVLSAPPSRGAAASAASGAAPDSRALSAESTVPPNTSWLGSPALFLPQRLVNLSFSEQSTFKPTRWLYLQRYLIEFVRITLPVTVFVILTVLMLHTIIDLRDARAGWSTAAIAAVFPLLYLGCGLLAVGFVVVVKWLLMDRYKPCEKPLWSHFVWRTELLTALHENLADAFLVDMLVGTPWVCWFFRLMGARIGRRVFLDTTCLTEFDLITIGDDCCINAASTLQTHLFEDRVMKMSTIAIGPRCSIGTASVVLYDTAMAEGSSLGDLSLLMKGETLPAGTEWEGSPAIPRS